MLGDTERIIGLNQKGEAGGHRIRAVGVLVEYRLRGRVDAVEPAAVVAVPDAGAKSEYIVNQRAAMGDADFVARFTAAGEGDLAPGIGGLLAHAGLRHNVADRAAL